jgi:hypothetical protein
MSSAAFSGWHKALLWFLGAVALLAVAGPAPSAATMIVLIIIVGVLLGHWKDSYAPFLGLATA